MAEQIKYKEFKPTSWAIDNKTSIYMLAIILALFGLMSYFTIPKEQFPEIQLTYISVGTLYPGTSPADIENFITRPLEKQMKSLEDIREITSTSVQDFSSIIIEFNPGIDLSDARQRVKDAVDKARRDLPSDLDEDPVVEELDFSEFPIMNINLSGDYSLQQLKVFADDMTDRLEEISEISRVDIVGALDREIQIDVDMYKMQAAMVTLRDIQGAIQNENVTISGGNIDMEGMSRSVRVVGEFANADVIKNIALTSASGAVVRLSDISEIKDSHKKVESFSRLSGQNVVTLNVIKKSGENLINAANQIQMIIDEMKTTTLPEDLRIVISGDQSYFTKIILKDLNNTIIIGFILVTIVLMFFMGLTNALFVGLSVPLSMALAYIVIQMPGLDFTLNMLVMFSFIFALGIVVDDAIVVIENTHRIFTKTGMEIKKAAKYAAGEVFVPILSGTLTTLAPFFPLAFWPGVVGKFMYYIPVTLIVTLFASLIVAYFFNPVFAVSFMKPDEDEGQERDRREIFRNGLKIFLISLFFYLPGFGLNSKFFIGVANLGIFVAISYVLHNLYMWKVLLKFQRRVIPRMLRAYEKTLRWALKGRRPGRLVWSLVGLFIITLFIFSAVKPNVLFFPEGDPGTIMVNIKMPIGTEVAVTDSITRQVEDKVFKVLGDSNHMVESVITNVGKIPDLFSSGATTPNLARVSVNFVEFSKRHGEKTTPYLDRIRSEIRDIAGAELTVDKEANGPPVGKPINIEIEGENLEELIATTNRLRHFIDSTEIGGIEELKSDFETFKPELVVNIDRQRANREGITTGQIGSELRTAITGVEVSKYREEEDQYPIQLRYNEYSRENIDRLMNLKITFLDMATGRLKSIPLSSVATINYQNTYGGITRQDLKRVITLSSNLLSGYNSNEVNMNIRQALPNFSKPESIGISLTGEQEDQAENMVFLSQAMLVSIFLVLFILVTQFNSLSKPVIILSEIIFSIIGVLLGFSIFGMDMSIIMTGMGIVALAGIVVRNGILLVDFTDKLKDSGERTREAIIQAGKIRITPIVLTATATILGLIPLAIGFNINFGSLITELNPQIHIGGDTKDFFGPLAWSIIFGLTFATVLTLVFIPIMYSIIYTAKLRVTRRRHWRRIRKENRLIV